MAHPPKSLRRFFLDERQRWILPSVMQRASDFAILILEHKEIS
jgi:hypothetical protein